MLTKTDNNQTLDFIISQLRYRKQLNQQRSKTKKVKSVVHSPVDLAVQIIPQHALTELPSPMSLQKKRNKFKQSTSIGSRMTTQIQEPTTESLTKFNTLRCSVSSKKVQEIDLRVLSRKRPQIEDFTVKARNPEFVKRFAMNRTVMTEEQTFRNRLIMQETRNFLKMNSMQN